MRIIKVDPPFESDGKWIIRSHYRNGSHADHTYDDERGAKRGYTAQNRRCKPVSEVDVRAEIEPPDGSIGWYSRILAAATYRVATDGDSESRNNLKAIAAAALAAEKIADTSDTEARLSELEEKTAHIDGLERFAAGA